MVAEHLHTSPTMSMVAWGLPSCLPHPGQEQQHQPGTDPIQAAQPAPQGGQLAKPQLGIPLQMP